MWNERRVENRQTQEELDTTKDKAKSTKRVHDLDKFKTLSWLWRQFIVSLKLNFLLNEWTQSHLSRWTAFSFVQAKILLINMNFNCRFFWTSHNQVAFVKLNWFLKSYQNVTYHNMVHEWTELRIDPELANRIKSML